MKHDAPTAHPTNGAQDPSPPHPTQALNDAIDHALGDLQVAAGRIQHDADDVVSSAARALNDSAQALARQVRAQADAVVSDADREVRTHPLAAAAGVAVAAAALTGLVVAGLTHKSAPAAPPKPR
jgi:ElaB/YqjD/DUF883 family membrane-anchored ribosome-binding protein